MDNTGGADRCRIKEPERKVAIAIQWQRPVDHCRTNQPGCIINPVNSNGMSTIRIIVVDDERSARHELKQALKKYADCEVIGEAKNASEAKELIEAKRPDVIFLDIQMPEQSGFQLL